MLIGRGTGFSVAVFAVVTLSLPAIGASDNTLRRDKGIVTFEVAGGTPVSLTGEVAVGNAVIASTSIATLATLTLRDSSEIRIGDRTTVRVGDLTAAAAGSPASGTIYLQRGAVRFNVTHPTGATANYRFVTPTTQVAVRGTVGYFVAGPTGNQIYCVKCEAGDVTITTATQQVSLRSGQTLNVNLQHGAITGTQVVANRTINNPAIDQFLGGVSPFGESAITGADITGSGSGLRF